MVGAERRLATELVVIMANAAHEMKAAEGARVRGAAAEGVAGTSAALMLRPPDPVTRR
ncbi:hypothetical protein GCM10023168_28770 [Fodinibacter luteus]|uniref:Uncharacterized protein n=1 Tax=Fodinibacter luteus TaxID=552064 RepID=A0ABP8KMA6_9MICO